MSAADLLREAMMDAQTDPTVGPQRAPVSGTWGDFAKAAARFPVKAAMGVPDLAQSFADWRTGREPEKPYSTQVEDALMARGLLPQRQDNQMDGAGDAISNFIPTPSGVGAGLGKMMGAMILPLGSSRFAPAVQNAEKLMDQGRHREAWDQSQSMRDGVMGVFRRGDGQTAMEIPDNSATFGIRKLEALDRKATKAGVPFSHNDANYSLPLPDVMRHPKLYEAYPDLKDIRVSAQPKNDQLGGFYDHGEKNIGLVIDGMTPERIREVLLHEVQHGGQEIGRQLEGWRGMGSNVKSQYLPENMDYALGNMLSRLAHTTGNSDIRTLRDSIASNRVQQPVTNPNYTGNTPLDPMRTATRRYNNELGEGEARMTGLTAYVQPSSFHEWARHMPHERMQMGRPPLEAQGAHTIPNMSKFYDKVSRAADGKQEFNPYKYLVGFPNE